MLGSSNVANTASSPMSEHEKAMAETDLKFFRTTKLTKVGVKYVDLV